MPALLASTLFLIDAAEGPIVRWRAPGACPSERQIQREIRRALADAGPAPPLTVEAEVTAVSGSSLRLEVVVLDGEAARARPPIEADACDELAGALALFVDELWRARASSSPSPPQPRTRPRAGLHLAPIGGINAVKGRALVGGEVVGVVEGRRARLEIGVGGDASPRLRGGWWWRLQGALRACVRGQRRALDLHLCSGLAGGFMVRSARPDGLGKPTLEAQLGPSLIWWVHRHVGLWIGGRVSLRLIAVSEGAREREICWPRTKCLDYPPVGFAGGVGVEFRWDR